MAFLHDLWKNRHALKVNFPRLEMILFDYVVDITLQWIIIMRKSVHKRRENRWKRSQTENAIMGLADQTPESVMHVKISRLMSSTTSFETRFCILSKHART